MFFNCTLIHPTVMFRRDFFSYFTYPTNFPSAEDYALWLNAITMHSNIKKDGQENSEKKIWKMANLPPPHILQLRKHPTNSSKVYRNTQKESTEKVLVSALKIVTSDVRRNSSQKKLIFFKVDSKPGFLCSFTSRHFTHKVKRANCGG